MERRCARELGLGRADRRFPQKGTCLDIYSRCVNAQQPLGRGAAHGSFPWCLRARGRPEAPVRRLRRTRKDEQQRARLRRPPALLARAARGPRRAAREVRKRFDHVLVDEYQDTNALQADIVQLLRPDGTGVTVVGDDAQSIYSLPRRRRAQHPRLPARCSPAPTCCRSSRTTAPRSRSSTPPTRVIAGPPSGTRRTCGPRATAASARGRDLPRRGRADRLRDPSASSSCARAACCSSSQCGAVPRHAPLAAARAGARSGATSRTTSTAG